MSKLKKYLTPGVTAALFALAAVLLLTGTIGGARAALTSFSQTYSAQIQMYDIGITLIENEVPVARRDYVSDTGTWDEGSVPLLENMLAEGEELKLGKEYREELQVANSGSINTYVRVTVYKYWVNADGEKDPTLSPDLIQLDLGESGGWTVDSSATTPERTVLNYGSVVPSGGVTSPFATKLTISPDVALYATQVEEDGGNAVRTVYDYDGCSFRIEVKADAVQDHNAQDAMRSAWGVTG